MAETEKDRRERHGSMDGIKVRLPDGREMVTDDKGKPIGFRGPVPEELIPEPPPVI